MKPRLEDNYHKHVRKLEEIYGKQSLLAKEMKINDNHSKLAELRKAGRKLVEKST